MSIYKDYKGNYFQTVQKYKDSISKQAIELSINTVVDFVRNSDPAPNELLDFHNKTGIFREENYKYDILHKTIKYVSTKMRSKKEINKILPLVNKIEALDEVMQKLSDEELRAKTYEFKERLKNGETVDDLLVEAFAVLAQKT